jgi:phage-related minor tail protein
MANNIIELVIKATDQATAPLQKVTESLGGMKTALLGFIGIASAGALFKGIISNSSEAEQSLAHFNRAFEAFGDTLGVTRKQLNDFAVSTQNSTRFSDEAVRDLQATLIRFGTITGDNFKRAQQAAVDLAAGMGIDLSSAGNILARAMAAPESAMRLLRQAGINLTAAQKDLIKSFSETGDSARSMDLILSLIEKRFSGAAVADVHTFEGALKNLKNVFDELLETNVGPLASGINEVAATVKDPAFADAVKGIFGAITAGAALAVKALAPVIEALANITVKATEGYSKIGAALTLFDAKTGIGNFRPVEVSDSVTSDIAKLGGLDAAKKKAAADTRGISLDFIKATPHVLSDEDKKSIRRLAEAAAKESERVNKELRATILQDDTGGFLMKQIQGMDPAAVRNTGGDHQLADNGDLTPFKLMRGDFGDAGVTHSLEEPKKAMDDLIKTMNDADEMAAALGKHLFDAWDPAIVGVNAFVDAFKSGFADMLQNGKLTIGNLVRFIIAELAKKALFNAIDNIGNSIKDAFSGSGSSGGGGGFVKSAFSFLGTLFGHNAGGGSASGWTTLGEEGPENVWLPGGSKVMNQRQMAFAGGGAAPNVSTTSSIVIQAKSDDAAQLRQEFYNAMQINNRKQRTELERSLYRNGFGRLT